MLARIARKDGPDTRRFLIPIAAAYFAEQAAGACGKPLFELRGLFEQFGVVIGRH